MHLSRALWSLAIAIGVSAQSSYYQEQLSFGHPGTLSADRRQIPNFSIAGSPSLPSTLSDRLILTPASPGNHRGSVWAEKPLNFLEWTVDVDFRAAGQGRVGGNLQIWLVKDGKQDVGMSSIYTVETFDGLALVVDTYGGTGGTIRGFLNDGLSNYKNHHAVDSLAFGHCARAYRNLGRPTQIKLEQTRGIFKVSVDGQLCFESAKIRIPQGYYLGVTAASTEDPDSFEVFKLVVTTSSPSTGSAAPVDQDVVGQSAKLDAQGMVIGSQEDLPEQAAESISQEKQFADLHYRLQALMKHISMFQRDFQLYQRESSRRHDELKSGKVLPNDQLIALNQRMELLESNVEQIKKAVGVDYPMHMEDLKRTIGEHHSYLIEGMTGSISSIISGSKPRLGFFVFVIVGSQALLALSYIIYKRRRSMMPKKYL